VGAPGGGLVRQLQLVSVKDGLAYTLIGSHLEGTLFKTAREELLSILLSLS
jgi:hypothetical protein